MYEHDYGCDSDLQVSHKLILTKVPHNPRRLQAVDVIDQRGASKQVDVDINICFCSSQNCNEVISRGDRQHAAITWAVVLATVIMTYY